MTVKGKLRWCAIGPLVVLVGSLVIAGCGPKARCAGVAV